MVKIACDTTVATDAMIELEGHGHKIVRCAAEGELDEWWFADAVEAGAELFITTDLDIMTLAINKHLQSYMLPQGVRGVRQAWSILKHIRKLTKQKRRKKKQKS